MTNETKKILKKQSYRFVGDHTSLKICDWNKQALRGYGECYKYQFYGIPSWRCCQISPWIICENRCTHCWRPIELDMSKALENNKINSPEEIIEECVREQRKLLIGFNGFSKLNKKRYKEAQDPSHFAISLIGEPTLYPYIGDLIAELRKKGKTSFIVSNGLHPEILKKLDKKKQLPTQLYISLNSSNKFEYDSWHKSSMKNAWKKYNQSLDLMKKFTKKGKRTILRMTIARDKNMSQKNIKEFAELIKKSGALFVEVKSYMPLGYARARMGYDYMLTSPEVMKFSKQLVKELGKEYAVLDEHYPSRICLVGKKKDKKRMKIKKSEI